MSDKTIAINQLPETAVVLNPVLRYAFGATIIMLVAMSLNYTLAYLTPVLALTFLAPGAKPPTMKTTVLFLLIIAVTSMTGILFSRFFLDYPLVFMPLLILTIFHIYYTTSLQNMKVWFIISLLLIPMISLQSAELGNVVAVNLIGGARPGRFTSRRKSGRGDAVSGAELVSCGVTSYPRSSSAVATLSGGISQPLQKGMLTLSTRLARGSGLKLIRVVDELSPLVYQGANKRGPSGGS